MKQEKGVITVFLALIFSIIFVFLCSMIEVTRVNSAKNQLIIASDAAITSALSDFDKELYESYGLLAYEDSDEIKSTVKEILEENLTDNGLFDINIDESQISVESDKNPFESNDVFKKQAIYSMKYKGTENLAREVFEEIKELLGAKDVIKESETMEELDKDAEDDLGKDIERMQEGKMAAMKAIIELAKNNSYPNLKEGTISYIEKLTSDQLLQKYNNETIKVALNAVINNEKNINKYNSDVVLGKAYSNRYTKMILEMYCTYLEEEKEKYKKENPIPQNNTTSTEGLSKEEIEALKKQEEENNKKAEEINKKLKEYEDAKTQISYAISNLDNNFKEIQEEINSLKSDLKDYKKDVKAGREAVDDLLSEKKRKTYDKIVSGYGDIASNDGSSLKESASDNKKYYVEELNTEKLNSILRDLKAVEELLETVIDEIPKIVNNMNLMIKGAIVWTVDNIDNSLFTELNNSIGLDFKGNIAYIDLLNKICGNAKIKSNENVKLVIEKVQIDTLKGITVSENSRVDVPEENNKFKDFYEMFKKNKKDSNSSPSLKEVLNNIPNGNPGVIDKSGLPNGDNSGKAGGKLSEQIEKAEGMGEITGLGSLLEAGGGFVDKLYLMEYIMSDFKDAVQPKEPGKRIPELTDNDGKLNFEIEAIISGEYNDEKSKTTMKDDFWGIRYILNFVSFMKYTSVKNFINTVATTVSTATYGAIPAPLVKWAIIATWVGIETNYDVIDLYNGYEVPLIKEDFSEWVSNFGLKLGEFGSSKQEADNVIDVINSSFNSDASKKGGEAYNAQGGKGIKLNYTDLIRFKLLVTDEEKLINRAQDIIVGNKDLQDKYSLYKSQLEVKVEESNVNVIFDTPSFSGEGGNHKFKGFSFKREYN